MSAVFDLRAASVQFGSGMRAARALKDITLQIVPGERVALVGANGCGKSTLLRLLHGLVDASAGTVHRNPALTHAMLFQRPFLMRMSVQANIALALWWRGKPWHVARQQALLALERVGMAEHAQRNARVLSGGQQQRVALARAWALAPQVLLLDEPTASLDPHAKRDVEALMQEFVGHIDQVTLVFASHNLGQVKRLASRVIYLELGRVLADLPVDGFFGGELLARHYPQAHFFVKGETL
ncbi:MAG: phosphate ABC transporter ATP-binding protein [Rhodoferax sp.]|nr:phosphate ABC transporter ATP-binding protein [Rhodoferax sp.]